MRYQITLFQVASIALSLLQFWSCSGDINRSPDDDTAQVEKITDRALALATTRPDSSLYYADSAIRFCSDRNIPDSVYQRALIAKADALANTGMPDSALSVIQNYYFDKTAWPDSSLLLKTLYSLCRYNYLSGRLALAEQYGAKAVNLVDKIFYSGKKAPIINLYASTQVRFGRYEEAQTLLFRSVSYAEQQGDTTALGDAYSILGNVYLALNNWDKAREYVQKSHKVFSELRDTLRICAALNDWGITCKEENPDSALLLYNESLRMTDKYPGHFIGVASMFNKADIYVIKADKHHEYLDTARSLYEEVHRQCQKNRIEEGIPKVLGAYGKIAYKLGDYTQAGRYFTEAIEASQKQGDINNTIDLMTDSREMYKRSGQLVQLFKLDERIRFLQDSVRRDAQRMALLDKEWVFLMQKKELENDFLRKTLKREERISQLRLILLVLLATGVTVLAGLVIWNRNLQRGLGMAYQVLMARYRSEGKVDTPEEGSSHDTVIQRLFELFEAEKPFLNPEMRVSDVQKNLDVSAQELSAALRENGFENFNVFLNQARVKEVQKRFELPEFDHYSIEAIAKDAGFGSRTSFYRAFEAVTGVRPAYYRSRIRGNIR